MSGDTAEQQAANEKNLENLHLNNEQEDNASPSELSVNGTTDNATNNDESDDDSRKLFVGGLSYETDSTHLRDYFSKWGKVTQSIIKFDHVTGYSRGFGFVTFESEDCVLQVPEHKLNNRKIDPKRAKPSREPMKKIFVGGIDPDLTEDQIRQYFGQYGTIDSLDLPFDTQKGKRKNYIFVCFTTGAAAKKAITKERQEICGKQCDVRLAVTREQASRQKALKQYGNIFEPYQFQNYAFADILNAYASIDPYQYPYYGYDMYGNPPTAHTAAAPAAAFGGIYSDYAGAAANIYRSAAATGTSPIKPLSVAGAAHHAQFSAAPPNTHHPNAAATAAGLHPQVYGLPHRASQPQNPPQARLATQLTGQPAVAVHYATGPQAHHASHTNGPTGTQNPAQAGPAPVMDHDFSGMWQSQAGPPATAYTRT